MKKNGLSKVKRVIESCSDTNSFSFLNWRASERTVACLR